MTMRHWFRENLAALYRASTKQFSPTSKKDLRSSRLMLLKLGSSKRAGTLISPGRSLKPSICLERRHPGKPDKLREDDLSCRRLPNSCFPEHHQAKGRHQRQDHRYNLVEKGWVQIQEQQRKEVLWLSLGVASNPICTRFEHHVLGPAMQRRCTITNLKKDPKVLLVL